MSRPYKGISLHEGFNTLETIEVTISDIEVKIEPSRRPKIKKLNDPELTRLFKLECTGFDKPREAYKGIFTLSAIGTETFTFTSYASQDGYLQVTAPDMPITVFPGGIDTIKEIPLRVSGFLDNRQDETYLRLVNNPDPATYYYTLLKDLVVKVFPLSGNYYLGVSNGTGSYYKISPAITVPNTTKAVYISSNGGVSFHDGSSWGTPTALTFYSLPNPDGLTPTANDGIYTIGAAGTPAPYALGAGPFAEYRASNARPEKYFINYNLQVFAGNSVSPFHTQNINLLPGGLDVKIVPMTCPVPVEEDDSPTLGEVGTLAGVTFTGPFVSYMTGKGFTTLKKIQKAGPLSYLKDVPADPATGILQSYVDLYLLNNDENQVKRVITQGYTNIFDIATTSKDAFLADVVNGTLPIFDAAEMHEVAAQSQKYLGLVLSGTLVDYKFEDSPTPKLVDSDFAEEAFANNLNACGCSDCKSMVSPFAYMLDLLKYCSEHIDYTGYDHSTPNSGAFIAHLTAIFHQPFGTLPVSCDTLHAEYCRVRLVTEILEKVVGDGSDLRPYAQTVLDNAMSNYLMLIYKALLRNAGTSIEELRNIISIADNTAKEEASRTWAERIGLPFMVPATSLLTSERLWLTVNNSDPDQELTQDNIEILFGFRSITKVQTDATPKAQLLIWKEVCLEEIWKAKDYYLSAYSREGATSVSTPEANWKPIIDPDNMGMQDMTYNIYGPALKIWQNRKKNTDDFLSYYHDDASILKRTSADMNSRQVKVLGRNLLTQQIDSNTISLQNSTPAWVSFTVYSKALINTDSVISLSSPSPAMFIPNGASPKMRYKRVLAVPANQTGNTNSFTITWPTEVIADVLASGYVRLESSGEPLVTYASSGGTYTLAVTYPAGNKKVAVTITGTPPSSAFSGGNVNFVYEVEVPLFTDQIPDPGLITDSLMTKTETYTATSPAFASAKTYEVWDTPGLPPWDSAESVYNNLKVLYQGFRDGSATEDYYTLLEQDLRISTQAFNRMMELLVLCENYLSASFTAARPTESELYELASLFRECGKSTLRDYWIEEELRFNPSGSSPILLQLSAQHFWKPLVAPKEGAWDPGLQTIPATGPVTDKHIPIIDPELVLKSDMLQYPANAIYLNLYDARVVELAAELATLYSWSGTGLFTNSLNYVATGSSGTAYNVSPFADIDALFAAMTSNDIFQQASAVEVAWNEFRLNKENFVEMMGVKNAYESADPTTKPSSEDVDKALRILVSAYKRKQLYNVASTGWVQVEMTLVSLGPVYYYNVFPMKLSVGRSNAADRTEWQKTLASWNRQPFVNPDSVPPENIKSFITGNAAHDKWVARKSAENTLYDALHLIFKPASPITNGGLLIKYLEQIDLLIARQANSSLSPISGTPYVHYFTDIAAREKAGEDIVAILEQLGFTIGEYRYLRKIYDFLLAAVAGDPASLFDEEYDDISNIMLMIRKRNLSFTYVREEYTADIYLTDDFFVLYKPAQVKFPQNQLPVVNPWRFSLAEQKDWEDTLEGRIERKQGIQDQWKEILLNVEDENMPYLRDAYISALQNECESFDNAADRLAKSYFIETRDNCCVKHTRVSFALETIQGLVFALQNGVFDEYIGDFKLYAPYIAKEWQWIGSYASWRSAVFVFVYPENLLYPTLKRQQSPMFMQLANTLQGETRFTPQDACDAAKAYTEYFNDIMDLEMICSTNTSAKPLTDDPASCCDASTMQDCATTFFFAKSQASGYTYWSRKNTNDLSPEAHSFWERLDLPKDANPLGCYTFANLNDKGIKNGESLWLFYTYWESGKLVLAYSIKDVSRANTGWKDEKVADLPTFTEIGGTYTALHLTACQQSWDDKDPSLLITYKSKQWGYYHCHVSFSRSTKKMSPEKFDMSGTPFVPSTITPELSMINNWDPRPISAVRFRSNPNVPGSIYETLAVGFEDEVYFLAFGINATFTSPLVLGGHFIGLYELNGNSGEVMVLYNHYNPAYGHCAKLVAVTYSTNVNQIQYSDYFIYTSQLTRELQQAYRVYPVFADNSDFDRIFAIGTQDVNSIVGAKIYVDYSTFDVTCAEDFMLTVEPSYRQPSCSADCVADLKTRKLMIKQHLEVNANSPLGNVPAYYQCTSNQLEYLAEAYYHVPMLLALDQQQRGQYEDALDFYKVIYDYTEDLNANRKIYYGLILEESIHNTTTHATDWLLDPLNPHLIAKTRANSHTKYVLLNIIQCMFGYADRQYTLDTVETVPQARKLYTAGLDLLKTSELALKQNTCYDIATACLGTGTALDTDPAWSAMVDKLQGLLNSYGDPETLTTIVDDEILPIFNNLSLTLEQKFTAAFDYLYAHPPGHEDMGTVNDVVVGIAETINDTYRYVLAVNSPAAFQEAVASSFKTSVANVSGMSRSTVSSGTADQLNFLTTATPQNTTLYSKNFINSDGTQNLSRSPFNPLAPDNAAFTANVARSNGTIFVDYESQNKVASSFVPLVLYPFCLPSNPVYNGLELRGNLELYKIFNCRNIAGMVRELDPYAAATDSTTGVPVIGAGGTLNVPGNKVFSPSQYRFRTLINRAKELVGQSQQLESLFLAAMEKLDAENYSYMQAKQGLETAKSTVRLQDMRISQANNEKAVVALQKTKTEFMKNHFNSLIQKGLNSFEQQSVDYLKSSITTMNKAITLQQIAATIKVAQGLASVAAVAGSLDKAQAALAVIGIAGEAVGAASGVLSSQASLKSTMSQLSSMQAGYERRKEEWDFQVGLSDQDIGIANQQLQVADDNVRIVTQEREIANLNVTHAEETLNFLQNKFTNAALYGWMSGVLERSYNYMLNTSTAIARTAERQLYFERQAQAGPFILNDYWETPSTSSPGGSSDRRGLTGSARLLVDITKLEQHAFDSYKRKLQMTKVISLASNFPSEFQLFRETGILNFQLTNKQFDYDYPGHYLRLINDVRTTFVGLTPVYDSIKATLTASAVSYTVIGGNTFQKTPIKRLEIDSVALTNTMNASGVFELQAVQSETLNPFEGMGIESGWEFKLPQFSNRFDFNNIADVVLTVNYTAMDSYLYRYQVLQELDNKLSFSKPVSLKNDFPDQWYDLAEAEFSNSPFGVNFSFTRDMFPTGVIDLKLNKAENIVVYFSRKDGYTQEIKVLDLSLYSAQSGTNYSGGETINGKFDASQLMNSLGNSPVMTLRLLFDNTIENRTMFKDGSVQDILILIPCKAELKSYPL